MRHRWAWGLGASRGRRPRQLPRAALTVVLSSILPAPAAPQAILNVERLQSGEVDGLHGEINTSFNISKGNTDLLQVGGNAGGGLKSSRHWTRIFLGMERLKKNDASLLDNRYLHVRYNYLFAEGLRSFHFIQLQTNQNLLLERRWLVGTGLRVRALGGTGKELELGSGLMYEVETLRQGSLEAGEDPVAHTLRMSNLLVGSWRPGDGRRAVAVIYYQPDVGRFSDYRLLGEAGMNVGFTRSLELDVSLTWRHDSRAPRTLEKDDVALKTGLTFRLR